MKKSFMLLILVAGMASTMLQSCERSQANVQTLISNDCGVTWELIPPGNVIPKRMIACELKTTVPGHPMTGASDFKTTFKNNVKAQISVDYEYVIEDAVKFISEAKYLARTNADGDDVSSGGGSRFESAENSIIDKRIKDVSRALLDTIDIVDFDQSEFEGRLLEAVNNILVTDRGVRLNFLSFVPEPSTQTAQAIDVATAMRIYESKGLSEVGKIIMAERAGATLVVTNVKNDGGK